ncbi:hypothetical protein PPTG_07495 [Phytophthora nicotianae INRA-310]|uniref:Uncharacterized protein n=1 Tax=Phytophthora nicotianae (strain INRA-310) TaxID=761204 RepID=W2QQB6_PHYN3|nr:hypothetical protein PPTG_07495 [Phytophthora nicotianae INRA-310]ETN14445.1 hypothetical protein PPTG_07495 [Phytophthora nicotianae INRA-310]
MRHQLVRVITTWPAYFPRPAVTCYPRASAKR